MHLADCFATERMSREAASDRPSIVLSCMPSDRRGMAPAAKGDQTCLLVSSYSAQCSWKQALYLQCLAQQICCLINSASTTGP